MTISLASLRSCFEGVIPSTIATCAPDGIPNVAYLSQVHYVDDQHVALSFQFFNKTRQNVLAHPLATVQVVDPDTLAHFRLKLRYLHTETEGPLFEHMKAKLAGIASHSGMSKVFRLQGADVYRVLDIAGASNQAPAALPQRPSMVSALRACSQRIRACADLAGLLDQTLLSLEQHLDIRHAMLLMLNETGDRLYTVASRGYPESGVGSEIRLGEGVIGVAARERTPIRIGYMALEYLYSRAARESFKAADPAGDLETEIPMPGLAESRSQLAVPIVLGANLIGVLYVESPQDLRFTHEDEDGLLVLADHLAMAIDFLKGAEIQEEAEAAGPADLQSGGTPATIRRYAADHSVFIGNDYLIKGVAGAIFWRLLEHHLETGRTEFTNRELRLDPAIRLPDITDNLEARLILLQRRLSERCAFLAIRKVARGRFRLDIQRPIKLVDVPAGARG